MMNDASPTEAPKPKLEQQLRDCVKAKHYRPRTADADAMWYRQDVKFTGSGIQQNWVRWRLEIF